MEAYEEYLKLRPFRVNIYSDVYKRIVLHTLTWKKYIPRNSLIYFYLYCMEDKEPIKPVFCCCSCMQWLEFINSSLPPEKEDSP